jgi:hypothetical protein
MADSVLIGMGAGDSITTANQCVFIGTKAGQAQDTVGDSVCIGFNAGYYGDGAGHTQNIFIGTDAGKGQATTECSGHVGIGYRALEVVTSGNNTIAIGTRAASDVTSGTQSVYVGHECAEHNDECAEHNVTGNDNVCMGYRAGEGVVANSYSNNTYIGAFAGKVTTIGASNVAVGQEALYDLTTSSYNVVLGAQAAKELSTGSGNNVIIGFEAGLGTNGSSTYTGQVVIGYRAGYALTTASYNVLIGQEAGRAVTNGTNNVMIGYRAGRFNVGGDRNVCIGEDVGYGASGQTYDDCVLLGYRAGFALTTGSDNILIGFQAGNSITTGGQNICIGYDVDVSAADAANEFRVGYTSTPYLIGKMSTYQLAIAGASGYLNFNTTLGSTGYGFRDNAGVMELKDSGGAWENITSASDRRLKKDIENDHLGLNFILALQPVRFQWKKRDKNWKDGRKDTGLIAQDVKMIMDKQGVDFGGWKALNNEEKTQKLDYQKLTLPLINSVKELNDKIEFIDRVLFGLERRVSAIEETPVETPSEQLEIQIAVLQKRIEELERPKSLWERIKGL